MKKESLKKRVRVISVRKTIESKTWFFTSTKEMCRIFTELKPSLYYIHYMLRNNKGVYKDDSFEIIREYTNATQEEYEEYLKWQENKNR